ncbi:MAG: hypothetical protein K8963_10030 [Proteobacteria bacterium]|nr:hypothetical protein [Pseudomonadota bacterium]
MLHSPDGRVAWTISAPLGRLERDGVTDYNPVAGVARLWEWRCSRV